MTDTAQGSASAGGWSPERSAAGGHNPYLIAFVVSIATFMEVLDTTIANVALRHIAGGLAVGIDESTYVITSYLVANAIVLSISGWLSTVIGRKRFYMMCVAIFTVSSLLCGFAWNLQALVLFRILQGLGGGGMATSEQAILADSFPPHKRGQAFAIYGVAVVVAPVVGPTLGGWITDTYTWHWVFLINVPMGLLSLFLVGTLVKEPSGAEEEREKLLSKGLRVDYVGFLLVAIGLGSLEYVLDEGQRNDWFGSNMIVFFAVLSAMSLLALIPWELTREDPIVDLRLLGRRQFAACFMVMLATGAVLISTTQLLPQLLQSDLNYTAMLAGLALSPGGVATLVLMPVVGRLVSSVQPKYLIMFGAAIVAFSMWHLTGLTGDITYGYAAMSRIFLALGLPFLFLPVTTASYDGVPPDKTNQASALINVARNIGGSMGVALAQTILAQRQQFHQSRLIEHAAPSDLGYQQTIETMTRFFQAQGSNASDAASQAVAWVGRTLQQQVDLLAYIDVFWTLAIIAVLMIPTAAVLRPIKLGAPARGH
ncbi:MULTISPECIES: DHA2 family efflux MFS transporter permease subunit [unclassified Bradyrhizobium]|jgi:MFS transporter, DHA2 family, multidrug resistance protein|uniref:DHA2 family efflux MFS transporter permease subunit n=1 Tax=unclassified Bradyrhizobium TaxID=2631580 RepID=UPI001FF90475|nr:MULTISPECIES: DHA2 family efflux MFS transporter permease subunit [unclassified Bradyrhizobium]MCK1333839.1 DHA2 family efflux MFS transporter permease subunit [Bradyrhizobium sp. CW9]MCK1353349.1 DHA2 family efflux MFS transporter permease subunit [Bradyrhizobium sp. CW7]MCK1538749.1 DHA2 family efflux MFS transporter permease subunit [Bradyrhizobium sp. 176]MCK1551748.1 DHA2 family efflux MFS transporter permease subunit [Bradyrhizobium sp. 177]MCK1557428.1 DHA2 family efflux MFS transpor